MRIVLMMAVTLSIAMAEPTMVKDVKTNLIWEDSLHNTEEKVTHSEAKAYCETLKIADVENWRLPTLFELLTIVDYTRYKPASIKEFKHVDDDTLYWSSTVYARSSTEFWGINFEDGTTDNASENYDRLVRCVSDIK